MKKVKIAIYLAGKIQKAHEGANECYWTEKDLDQLKKNLPLYEITFLNPALRSDDLSDQKSVFGRDMLQVFCSDLVLADVRDRRGLGVGAEMMWAKLHKIPLIAWSPKDSHYNKSETILLDVPVKEWVHPFVHSLSDHIAETLEDAAQFVHRALTDTTLSIKGVDYIESAMQHYKKSQLPLDIPMKDLLASHEDLQDRLQLI